MAPIGVSFLFMLARADADRLPSSHPVFICVPSASDPNNPRVAKALIAGKYNGVDVEVVPVEMGKSNKTPEFLKKFPLGKVPAFEANDGFTLYESNAIAFYVAAYKQGSDLLGASPKESAVIQQFIGVADNEIHPAAATWLFPILGWIPHNAANEAKAKADIAKVLSALNAHLLTRTFLVGETVTLADITVVCSLLNFFRMVFDAPFRAQYKNVTRWFLTCVNQPQFKEVLGDVVLAEKAQVAGAAPAVAAAPAAKPASPAKPAAAPKEKAPKAVPAQKPAAAPKKKDDDEEEEENYADEKPKAKNPLDLLPKSDFNLEEWKRFYSNNDTRPTAVDWFWSKFDPAGYSIYRLDYKYNSELTLTFMSSNLVGGVFHRLESARKYAFGCLAVLGEDNKNSIAGYFVYRGDGIPAEVQDTPDFESWTFTRCDPSDAKTRELFNAYIAWDEVIEGKTFADAKVFK
ncbi:Elongation factor 1-gamma [Entophlyctis luteolus]|nr:Elongation factor 1-gamma [Entophlyctis luteolus]